MSVYHNIDKSDKMITIMHDFFTMVTPWEAYDYMEVCLCDVYPAEVAAATNTDHWTRLHLL